VRHKCSLDYLVSKLIYLKTGKAIDLTVPEKVCLHLRPSRHQPRRSARGTRAIKISGDQ
jgi:hypothetical protein